MVQHQESSTTTKKNKQQSSHLTLCLLLSAQAAQEKSQHRFPGFLGQSLPTGRGLPDGQGQPQVLQLPGLQERLPRCCGRQRQGPPGGPGAPEAGAAAPRAGGQRETDAGDRRQLRRLLPPASPEGPGVSQRSVSPRCPAFTFAVSAAKSIRLRERTTFLFLRRTMFLDSEGLLTQEKV